MMLEIKGLIQVSAAQLIPNVSAVYLVADLHTFGAI